MDLTQDAGSIRAPRLRLWPGVAAVLLEWTLRYVLPMFAPGAVVIGVEGGFAAAAVVLVWWLFFSRAPQLERWGAFVLMAAAMLATPRFLDKSIATGMMGMMFFIYCVPVLSAALVAGAAASRWLTGWSRRATLAAVIVAACGFWALLRTDGVTAELHSQFAWRWAQTPEEKLVARAGAGPAAPLAALPTERSLEKAPAVSPSEKPLTPAPRTETPPPAAAASNSAVWPGFRGAHRDGAAAGLRIKTDWTSTPPKEMWRRSVGPGWSSFAVGDGLIYTQEQRGDFEVVACYRAATGEPVWSHRDATRFWESNGGPGPRATPTLQNDRVYAMGATGVLNALDARSGALVWTRNAASDAGVKVPTWGLAGSPLLVDKDVIVAVAGRLAAYDAATGDLRWRGPDGGDGYSSPQLLTIGGVAQIVLLSGGGATSVAPADGRLLWKYGWEGSAILQPVQTADGGILFATTGAAGGNGTRRLAVERGPDGWTATEVWTSTGLKPYFNDLVVHGGFAFGFDGSILACIDLQDGKRKWKGGRYGYGELLLLSDQDLLLVLSEEGELALVAAVPGQFTELARIPVLQGKTWNHPALAGDVLLVRNGEEMAAFRLPLAVN